MYLFVKFNIKLQGRVDLIDMKQWQIPCYFISKSWAKNVSKTKTNPTQTNGHRKIFNAGEE